MYWHLTKCRYCYTASNEQTLNQMSLNRTSLLPSKTLNKIQHRIMELNHRMIEQNVIEWYNETSSNEPTFDQMSSSLKWQNDSFSYFVFFISIPLFVPSLSLSLSLSLTHTHIHTPTQTIKKANYDFQQPLTYSAILHPTYFCFSSISRQSFISLHVAYFVDWIKSRPHLTILVEGKK